MTKKASLHTVKRENSAEEVLKEQQEVAKKAIDNTPRVSILSGLPEYLKDRNNFPKVRKALYEVLASTCGHSDVIEWSACVKCQRKVRDHADMLRKLGFTSPAQYYAWRKTHEYIEKRVPLR